MQKYLRGHIRTLETDLPIWERFFTVASLVLLGTKEKDGYDLAPKHMATPMGWENYFGFVCAPRHRTYQNIKHEGVFTVSYPRPTQLVITSLAAAPRCGDDAKPSLLALPTFPASQVDGVFVEDAYIFLECRLERIIDGFGVNSLITGRIVAAHVHEDVLRTSEHDDQELIHAAPLLAYLYPGRIAHIASSYSFPFPLDFTR
ncbi:MAG TPA: flavin reductase [Candidatus Binatia bacterium]|nr:flavin reductase [Candidatus Binatia bacterium]